MSPSPSLPGQEQTLHSVTAQHLHLVLLWFCELIFQVEHREAKEAECRPPAHSAIPIANLRLIQPFPLLTSGSFSHSRCRPPAHSAIPVADLWLIQPFTSHLSWNHRKSNLQISPTMGPMLNLGANLNKVVNSGQWTAGGLVPQTALKGLEKKDAPARVPISQLSTCLPWRLAYTGGTNKMGKTFG